MASQSQFLRPEHHHQQLLPKRRRRHRIFDNLNNNDRQKTEQDAGSFDHCLQIPKVESEIYKIKGSEKGFVKIPKKTSEDNEFDIEQEQDVVIQNHCIDGIKTVGSEKFGLSGPLLKVLQEPSVFVRGTHSCINEASAMFKSVSELKSSFECWSGQAGKLSASIMQMEWAVNQQRQEMENDMERVKKLEEQLNAMKIQDQSYSTRLEQLDEKLDAIEIRNAMAGQLKDSQKEEQIKQFICEKGYTFQPFNEDDDEFVQTQFLPAHIIAQFIELRKQKSIEKKHKLSLEDKRIAQAVDSFHPCLKMTTDKYTTLCHYISQEYPDKTTNDVRLHLIFRKGTDLHYDWVGSKEDLEYKESLLFIFKNSIGQCLGGFMSNYLIEEEVREDQHAFLFCFDKQQPYKFKVRQQFIKQAFEASKHYLICFGSDLMISADCLEQESYCQWPNIYSQGSNCKSMVALAGEFSFMIEHIEVYEVII